MTQGGAWKIAILVATLAAIAGIMLTKSIDAGRDGGGGRGYSEGQSRRVTEASLPRFLELGSDKCIPCRMMRPILEDLRTNYAGGLSVEFIDVWKDRNAARTWRVESIPTQIILNADGREVARHVGFYPKAEIVAKLSELGIEQADGENAARND